MYEVHWTENGEKKTEQIKNRDEAFLFQSGLLARRKMGEGGKWDIEIEGVWNVG